jgi:hypothetical protein
MTGSLKDQTVLVIGRGSGLARVIALGAQDAGAQVIAAGRSREALAAAYAGEPGIGTETVDLTDEPCIAALGERLGTLDHVVSTASARARGRIADLDREAIRLSFDTKVIGPLMLAKHLAPRMNKGGSFVLFSGVAAAKIAVGFRRRVPSPRRRSATHFSRAGVVTGQSSSNLPFSSESPLLAGSAVARPRLGLDGAGDVRARDVRAWPGPGDADECRCHLLTQIGQVIGVEEARRSPPRRAVMLAFTIPAQRHWRLIRDCRHCER